MARFGQPLGPRPAWVSNDQLGGGRFILESGGHLAAFGLSAEPASVIETLTGRQVTVSGLVVRVDPIRPRVFTWNNDVLSVADVTRDTTTALVSGVTYSEAAVAQYASSADLLFLARTTELVAIDGTSGAVRRALPSLGPLPATPALRRARRGLDVDDRRSRR